MARPQQISDAAILAVITDLRLPHREPSGIAVRHALWARYGIRASTNRVYRLLKTLPAAPLPLQRVSLGVESQLARVTAERDAALQRAALAELREESTQSRLSMHIDALRQQLLAFGVNPYSLKE